MNITDQIKQDALAGIPFDQDDYEIDPETARRWNAEALDEEYRRVMRAITEMAT